MESMQADLLVIGAGLADKPSCPGKHIHFMLPFVAVMWCGTVRAQVQLPHEKISGALWLSDKPLYGYILRTIGISSA